jgi:hypothetical protein
MKSYFFFSVETGELLGKLPLPRPQGLDEACTIHNYNVVPLKNKNGKPRYVLVAGELHVRHQRRRLHEPGGGAGDRIRRSAGVPRRLRGR